METEILQLGKVLLGYTMCLSKRVAQLTVVTGLAGMDQRAQCESRKLSQVHQKSTYQRLHG